MVSDVNDMCHEHHLPPEADHGQWSEAINTIQLIISIMMAINNRSQHGHDTDTGKGKLEPTWSDHEIKCLFLWWIKICNSFQYNTIWVRKLRKTQIHQERTGKMLVHLYVWLVQWCIEARNFSLYSTNILSEVSSFYILYWFPPGAKLLAAHVTWLKPHHKSSDVSLLMRHYSHNSRAYWPEPQ